LASLNGRSSITVNIAFPEQYGANSGCEIDVLDLGASMAGEIAHRSESGQEQAEFDERLRA